jgi:hypothetical protein
MKSTNFEDHNAFFSILLFLFEVLYSEKKPGYLSGIALDYGLDD